MGAVNRAAVAYCQERPLEVPIRYLQEYGTERIRAAVLVDHAIDLGDPDRFPSRFISMQVEREEWTPAFVDAIHRRPQSDEYLDRVARAALSMPTNAAAIMIANIILMGPTDLGPALESVDRPVLFVASSQAWAVEAADYVRQRWPEVRVEVLEHTSHALFVDDPEGFNRVLETFVARLPAS
jgi:pimeloyl-ACP methyl ester carboxylesterase